MASPGAHVLVVDDDDLVRTVLVRQLELLGYRTTAVGDADAALDALDAGPDVVLVLTDMRLGGGQDGYALATAVRERRPGLALVFMTGLVDEDPAAAGFPGTPVLTKPFRQGDLAAALAAALG